MKDPTFVSAVVRVSANPTRVSQTLLAIDRVLAEKFRAYEVVVVNDSRTDEVRQAIADTKAQMGGMVLVMEMAFRQGTESAMLAGLDRAMGDFVFEIDDIHNDYPMEILTEMYAVARSGYDVVAAVPKNLPLKHRSFFAVINRLFTFTPPLTYERIRLSSRRALDALLQQPERVRYRQVLYRLTGYRYSMVSYVSDDKGALRRSGGRISHAANVFWSFADAGVGMARKMGTIFALIGLAAMIITVSRSNADPWYVVLEVIEIAGFTAIFILLTVVCEYLALILAQVRGRPLYTLDRTLTRTTLVSEPGQHPEFDAVSERDRAIEQLSKITTATSGEPQRPRDD